MWYHAIAYYGSKKRFWWNRKKDDLIYDVLMPFIGKHVKTATRAGNASIFNFGSVNYITIIATKQKLKKKQGGRTPNELSDANFIKEHTVTDKFVEEFKILKSSDIGRSYIERSFNIVNRQIFVIMKFNDKLLDSAYEGVIEPLCKEFEYQIIRVDKLQDSGVISQQILEHISTSQLIIADLSGERPNCYYEAGFAHALGKEIIFSIQEKDKIHFDLAGYRFITWATEAELRNKLRERLESISQKEST